MNKLNIGILGATGLVGEAILECIAQLEIPYDELRLFSSKKSEGKTVYFQGNDYKIEVLSSKRLSGLDVLFGAVSEKISKELYEMISQSGVVYIDNSSAFRLEPDVPLIIPEINSTDIKKESKLIANPNCSTILTLMAVAPIHHLFKLKRMIVSTYQAVSGAGKKGMDELMYQLTEYPNHPQSELVFQQPIINNCIASIGTMLENGMTTEEMKMLYESRKILHHDTLEVSCTCVRVPVLRSHCMSIYCETEKEADIEQLISVYQKTKGIRMIDKVPSPFYSSAQHDVLIGRIRKDLHRKNGILLWCSGDQIYKGAALNAVQIAQSILIK